MAREIKEVITRSSETILSDLIGACALALMLYVGLSLPGWL